MQRLLCTIGFTGKTAEEFFTLLSNAGVQQVIDIRQNRSGQLSGFSKHPDLSFFLKKIAGIEYLHEPLLAPAPELLKTYRRTKDWTSYETEFLAAMKERDVPTSVDMSSWSSKVSLLCSEPGPEKCHRRLVAELLAAFWREQGDAVEIRHLVSPRRKPVKPRRKSVGNAS
ncbi:MAG TPA: DUF488 domain-containing protein [Candidatus Acidoferrum sp.]